MWSGLSAALASSLEVASVVAWVSHGRFGFALALHATSSILAAFALPGFRPHAKAQKLDPVSIFCALTCFFVPVLGMVGLAFGWLLPLHRTVSRAPKQSWQIVPRPQWPLRPSPGPERSDMGGALLPLTRGARTTSRRLATLKSTRWWPDKMAVPILRASLADPEDEVRLLAYALLQSREMALYKRIDTLTTQAAKAPSDHQPVLRFRAAQTFWQLVDDGFATGAIRDRLLSAAIEQVEAALTLTPNDAAGHFLHGRLLLAQGALKHAETALLRSVDAGIPSKDVVPYLVAVALGHRATRREEANASSALLHAGGGAS